MSTSEDIQRLSHAIVAFAVEGRFPEDIAELPPVTGERLQPAIDDLAKARQKLEVYALCYVFARSIQANISSRMKFTSSMKKRKKMSAPGFEIRKRCKRI